MKKILTSLALLGAMVTGSYAQTDLQLTALQPVNNQQYPNFAAGDTMVVAAILKNNGPDDLDATDSVQVSFDLDWVIDPQGYVFRDNYVASELNCRVSGGSDTIAFAFIQGANVGTTPDGPAIIKIPSDAIENGINFKVFGFTTDLVLLDDVGSGIDDETGDIAYSGNNLLELQNVKFGNPTGVFNYSKLTKSALSTYPNPATDKVSFKFLFENGNATATITDVVGRTVLTKDLGKQTVGEKELSLDVSSLTSGIYYVELVNGDSRAISKITVQK